jgi:hypothetical protein
MGDAIQHQFWLLAQVRWQILRNSLRVKGKKLELAGKIFVVALGAVIGLALGALQGGVAYVVLTKGKTHQTRIIPILLEIIFGAWMVGPVLIEGTSPSLDFREIARYPVSFRLYYLLNLAYGLLDPWALLCLVWLSCIWLGVATARPDLAMPAALWFLIFAALNLLFNRALFGVLERVVNSRRGQEAILAVVLILMVSLQVVTFTVLPRWRKLVVPAMEKAVPFIHHALPAGFVCRGLLGVNWTDSLIALSALMGYGLLAALVLWRQSWRTYLGEVSSEAPRARAAVQMQPAWNLPWLDGLTAAIVEKELRYARRDSRAWMSCLGAPLMAFMFATGYDFMRETAPGLNVGMSTVYTMLTGLLLIGFAQQIYNFFSYDARGFQFWLMAPANFQRVLVGKNVAAGLLIAASYAVSTAFLVAKGGISFMRFLGVTGGLIFGALAMFAAGNIFSVRFPTKFEFGRISNAKPSVVSVLLGLVIQCSIMGSLVLLFYLTHRLRTDLLPVVALPLMILLALKVYFFSLQAASKYVQFHSEDIFAVLT